MKRRDFIKSAGLATFVTASLPYEVCAIDPDPTMGPALADPNDTMLSDLVEEESPAEPEEEKQLFKPDNSFIQLLRDTGNNSDKIYRPAMERLAKNVEEILNKEIRKDDIFNIFTEQFYRPEYPSSHTLCTFRMNADSAYVMVDPTKIPQRYYDGDRVSVPTYDTCNSINWRTAYSKDCRYDVIAQGFKVLAEKHTDSLSTEAWQVIMSAAFDRNLMVKTDKTGRPDILFLNMQAYMKKNGKDRKITHIYTGENTVRDWFITKFGIKAWEKVEADGKFYIYGMTICLDRRFDNEFENYLMYSLDYPNFNFNRPHFAVGLDLSNSDGYPFYITRPTTIPNVLVFNDDMNVRIARRGLFSIGTQGITCLDNTYTLLGAL